MSKGAGWHGLHLEIGEATGWDGEDMMVDGHFVSMNMAKKILHFESRAEGEATWISAKRLPGAFWIHPEGTPLSHRVKGKTPWAAAIIDGKFLDSVMGQNYELRGGINVVDHFLEHLFRALVEALISPTPPSLAITKALVHNFTMALATRHGHPAMAMQAGSDLTSKHLESLMAWIENNLETRLTVKAMAAQTNLSVEHFSRQFKRATGFTPWEHVVDARLRRATLLLKKGESVCATAQECGFFDQAHLSRLFKLRFGISPSEYAKNHKS